MSAVEEALARIAAHDGQVNAFTDVLAERARRAPGVGPLAGMPFAAKNLFDLKGIATRAGSKIRRRAPPATASST